MFIGRSHIVEKDAIKQENVVHSRKNKPPFLWRDNELFF